MIDLDSYQSPEAESLLRSARTRFAQRAVANRLWVTEAVAATLVLSLAFALAAVAPASQPLTLGRLAVATVAYLAACQVRFPVGAGWTRPTELVLVPMLFLLPTRLVPLVVIGCLVSDLAAGHAGVRVSPAMVFTRIADAAHVLGPATVLILTHHQRFDWAAWPVLALAFLAQVAVDLGTGLARTWLAERIHPREQLSMLWGCLVDACLACTALPFAAAVANRPGLILLALPLVALLGLFAREREQRLDGTLELSSAYRGTAILLADVIEADHQYTGMHSREVVELALDVAGILGLGATERLNVEFGALLHDVGKVRVSPAIIDKPGPLDDHEWAIMREHTVYGQEMLEKVGGTLGRVGAVVRASHEHWDGAGYPDGIAGEAIPIEARIVSACDAYNAMTTTRSYRRGMAPSVAIAELERCAGTQFDPTVVAALIRAVGLVP